MDGNSISASEVRSLAASIASASDVVDGLLRELRESAVTSSDLGDQEVAASYVRTLHGTLSESLAAFRLATSRLAETLERSAEHHDAAAGGGEG